MFTASTEVLALGVAGRTREAATTAERGWHAWRQRPDPAGGRWLAMADNEILALRLGGQFADAIARAEAYRADGESTLNPTHTAIGCAWLGHLAIATGQPATARRWLTESIAPLSRYDPCHLLYRVHLGLAEARALSGEAHQAATHLAAAHGIPHTAVAVLEPTDRLAEAWVAAAAGELTRAARTAIRAAAVARNRGQYGFEGLALHTALRFDSTTDAASRLRTLAERTENPLLAAFAAHATALGSRSGAGLDLAAEQLSTLGATLLMAEVAYQASAAWAAAGHRAEALAATARADRAFASCEGACTPIIARRAAATAGLSPRENEVAGLAARGLSNRRIADRLGVSVRTVESHLLQSYAKLGITRRAELAKVLLVD